MKILVTGGAGFIGSNFIHYWLKNHPTDTIVNLDKLSYAGNPANLKAWAGKPNYQFVHGDILDGELVAKLLADAEGLIHFAAESHVTRSEDAPEIFFENNVQGTKNLLNTAAKSSHLERVIHISTDEVYGSIQDGYFAEEDKEPGDHQASSAYAKSKSQADDVAQSFFGQLPLTIVRPTNNFGPYQYPEKALPRWATSALADQPLYVWGTGSQVRDWLHAEDTARALEIIWEKGETDAAYNIGANHQPEHPNLEIAERVLEVLGKPRSLIEMIPDPRPDHDFRYGVNTRKLQALGWQPGNFDTQFRQTVEWYRDNAWWWQPIKAEAEALYAGKERRH